MAMMKPSCCKCWEDEKFKNADAAALYRTGSTCGTANFQDFAAGTAAGIGEFCADAEAGFFAPSSQLNLLVLSKMR
jgi:hypothetical protein